MKSPEIEGRNLRSASRQKKDERGKGMPLEKDRRGVWIDITVPINTGMVHWPGDSPVRIERSSEIEKGDSNNLSNILMGSHTGTHMDAPLHFIREGVGIDEMPFDATVGPARVIEIHDVESIKKIV